MKKKKTVPDQDIIEAIVTESQLAMIVTLCADVLFFLNSWEQFSKLSVIVAGMYSFRLSSIRI